MGFLGFGGSPSLDMSQANAYMGTLAGIANGLQSRGNAATGQFDQFNTNDINALNQYSQYLTSNPATNQFNAEQTANAERNAQAGADRSTANFEKNLAERGISPNSSIGVGGLASIAQGLAANNADIQAKIGMNNEAQHNANLATNANLWTNAANNKFAQSDSLANQAAGIDQNLLNESDRLAMEKYQEDVANQGQDLQFLGTIGAAALPGLKAFKW